METGSLFLLGGDEDKDIYWRLLEQYLRQLPPKKNLLILMDAFPNHTEWVPQKEDRFRTLGFPEVNTILPEVRDSNRPTDIAAAIRSTDVLYIFGGDTKSYCDYYLHPEITQAVRERFHEGMDCIGLSTGAMMFGCEVFLDEKRAFPEYFGPDGFGRLGAEMHDWDDETVRCPGFGLLKESIVDVHFAERNRQGRLMNALSHLPDIQIGFGIDSDTSLILHEGRGWCRGAGQVYVMEKKQDAMDCYLLHDGYEFDR